jgi:hypothetical protein
MATNRARNSRKYFRNPFRPGETAHVYDFGGPNIPKYLGRVTIVAAVDPSQSLYVVRFRNAALTRVAVVARALQADPEDVLTDLRAHWAFQLSRAVFGIPVPSAIAQPMPQGLPEARATSLASATTIPVNHSRKGHSGLNAATTLFVESNVGKWSLPIRDRHTTELEDVK